MKFRDSRKEILILRDKDTDFSYGKKPEDRTLTELLDNGIVNIDKPKGMSSHQVSEIAKILTNGKKSGHSGTLDVNVTGVLPVLLNNATKVAQAFTFLRKRYVGIIRFHGEISDKELEKIFTYFTGEIYQKPPQKSAVKRNLRIKKIHSLKILERKDKEILFEVECDSGTYIRKLCHDIGLVSGKGANMQALRRTQAGSFSEKEMTTLHELSDAFAFYKKGDEKPLRKIIYPVEKSVEQFKKIWVSDGAVDALCNGSKLYAQGVCKLHSKIEKNEHVAIMSLKDELIALGKSELSAEEIAKATSGIAVSSERVIMNRGIYPKSWKPNL